MTRPSSSHYMPSTIHIPRSSSPLFSCSSSSSKRATAEDISRLLDPSYSSTHQSRSVSVYVDGQGDLHDPDYRHFPAIAAPPRSAKRNSAGAHYPLWDEHAVDDEEIDEDSGLYNHHSPIRRSPSSRRSSSTTVSRNNFAAPSSRTSSPPSYHYATYSTYDISPPTSYDSDDILSTSFSSYTSPFEEKEKRSSRLSTKRKRCSSKEELLDTPTPITRALLPTTEEEEDAPEAVAKDDDSGEWVPTCTQSLQRQWQALSLAFQFGVFRARRRMRQRVHSLL